MLVEHVVSGASKIAESLERENKGLRGSNSELLDALAKIKTETLNVGCDWSVRLDRIYDLAHAAIARATGV